jgi:hypothetical protein
MFVPVVVDCMKRYLDCYRNYRRSYCKDLDFDHNPHKNYNRLIPKIVAKSDCPVVVAATPNDIIATNNTITNILPESCIISADTHFVLHRLSF